MNKLLVTGGCGFIGSNFILHMLHKYSDCRIVNLDKLTYAGNPENLRSIENDPRYIFIKGDICDPIKVHEAMLKSDMVIHFAAETHVDRSNLEEQKEIFEKTNVTGTIILLEEALRTKKRFHHVSTDEVFGSLKEDEPKFNENTKRNPASVYSKSKNKSDSFVRHYFEKFKLPITISNCSNNYGPFQFPEKFIPFSILSLQAGEKIKIHGDGRNIRDWIHVQDHVEAIDLILQKGKIGETYCIGGDCELRNIDVAKKILQILRKEENLIEYVKDRPNHDWRYAVDSSKIQKELGWKPRINFEQGLEETVRWYIKNEAWLNNLKERVISNITEMK